VGSERRVVSVFARVSEYAVLPERQKDAVHARDEHIAPSLRMQPGFLGDLLLGDWENGRMLTVTLWESEEAMHATDAHARWYRRYGSEDSGGRVLRTRFYEVLRAPQNLGGTGS
jgi:heme-degrading monooxygenase HmoA